ncbi:MAG TPA: FIST C-terminal domain-containing protein, partial [Candidatus Paceibacterota bacterium]
TTVSEHSVTVTALHFEKTRIWFAETDIKDVLDSDNVGRRLAEFLPTEDLVHSFVLSEGLAVNGSALVRSINENLPNTVAVTGGLAGDGDQFKSTAVGCNTVPKSNRVALIGFYGTSLKVGYGSQGGWKVSGNPDEKYTITRSVGNVLYELNGEPALDVYKRLLGPELAAKLPSSGLLFPLQLELPQEGVVVRTILGIDENNKSMTFAGDMPQGDTAHLMHATEDDLIQSAGVAGADAATMLGGTPPQFAALVSCVGRRLVLKDRSHEEIEKVKEYVGHTAAIHGFYSYGELCPHQGSSRTLMHNQTMTVTAFAEI